MLTNQPFLTTLLTQSLRPVSSSASSRNLTLYAKARSLEDFMVSISLKFMTLGHADGTFLGSFLEEPYAGSLLDKSTAK